MNVNFGQKAIIEMIDLITFANLNYYEYCLKREIIANKKRVIIDKTI